MSSTNRRWTLLLVLSANLLAHSVALAHPLVDRGRRLYSQARFEEALKTFERAEEGTRLTRDDLVELLETRVLIFHAIQAQERLGADLRRLAALDPAHDFPPETPPEIVESFLHARARQPGALGLEATAELDGEAIVIGARVTNDSGQLVRSVHIHTRIDGGEWRDSEGTKQRLGAAGAEAIEYYVVAVGPGGATVANAGSPITPLHARVADLRLNASTNADPLRLSDAPDEDDRSNPWPWIGVGAGVVVAAAVVVLVLFAGSSTSDDTTLEGPMVQGF